jgi:hypothetical protein
MNVRNSPGMTQQGMRLPSASKVRDQVEAYERSGARDANTYAEAQARTERQMPGERCVIPPASGSTTLPAGGP